MEISLNLLSIISIVAIGLGCFFLLFLLLSKNSFGGAKMLLVAILAVLSVELFYDLLIYTRLIYRLPFLFGLNGFGGLLLYPLLFFYTASLRKQRWKWWYVLAFIPFVVGFSYKAARYLSIEGTEKIEMLDAFYRHTRPGPTDYFSNEMLLWTKVILPAVFLIGAVYQMRKLRQERKASLPFYYQGLQAVLVLALVYVLAGNFVSKGLYAWFNDDFTEWMVNIALMASLLVMLIYWFLKQLETGSGFSPEKKYKGSKLDKALSLDYFNQLSQLIEKDELYLDPDFTLSVLAKKMQVNSKYLSQAINENRGQSFSRYINQQRVEKAKLLLQDPGFKNYSIEGIAQEAGFRSKSAFYKAFREVTGVSPKEYQSRSDS